MLPKIREIVERVAASEGLEVLEVDLRGGRQGLLRIVIDKQAGVTHADCETVSRQVGAILDVEDIIPHRYTLEVSSPGAERPLKKQADFERFNGKLAKVVLKEPLTLEQVGEAAKLAGQGSVRGRISAVRDGRLTLLLDFPGYADAPLTLDLDSIARAHLVLEW